MDYLSTIISAHRTLIVATWTDTPVNGIWESEDADSVPWEQFTAPYAVIVFGEAMNADYAGDSASYEMEPEIYYIGSDLATVRTKLEALRDAYYATGLSTGQILEVSGIRFDDALAPNQIFASKNYAQQAGMIRVKMLHGEVLAS